MAAIETVDSAVSKGPERAQRESSAAHGRFVNIAAAVIVGSALALAGWKGNTTLGLVLPAALGFIGLAYAVLCVRPQRSMGRLIASDGAGGAIVRRLLPVMVLAPLMLAWLRLKGREAGLSDSPLGSTLLVTAWTLALTIVTWLIAEPVDRADLERRRALDVLKRANADLEERVAAGAAQLQLANKELESFAYSISHDLRSPLRAVDGFARILEEDHAEKLDDEGRRLLGVIVDNSQKMGELIDDLLEFSRLGRKQLSTDEIDMKRLVEDVLGELQAASERRLNLKVGALPPSYGDAGLLKRAWLNLLDNAVKFSSKREQPHIQVSGYDDGAHNVYCVRDNGTGFDMRYYDKLFEVFQRLHGVDEFEGTGVGLAIVERVVTRHGGRVWAEAKVDEGAAFYFSLPKGRPDGQV